jgi:hypothetical protein
MMRCYVMKDLTFILYSCRCIPGFRVLSSDIKVMACCMSRLSLAQGGTWQASSWMSCFLPLLCMAWSISISTVCILAYVFMSACYHWHTSFVYAYVRVAQSICSPISVLRLDDIAAASVVRTALSHPKLTSLSLTGLLDLRCEQMCLSCMVFLAWWRPQSIFTWSDLWNFAFQSLVSRSLPSSVDDHSSLLTDMKSYAIMTYIHGFNEHQCNFTTKGLVVWEHYERSPFPTSTLRSTFSVANHNHHDACRWSFRCI